MSRHVADNDRAERMTEAAANGYTGSYLEAQGAGLRAGLQRYGFQGDVDAQTADAKTVAVRYAADRGGAKVRHRAELECLTEAVYYEARSENARGQAAVAQVVMNRVRHPAFPKTVCGVVFQGAGHRGCQFSFTCDGSMRQGREKLAWGRARDVAARVLAGHLAANVGAATHYHTTAVSPFWAPQMLRVAQVGVHVFYKFSPYRLRAAPAGQPALEEAVLISGATDQVPELRIAPSIEKAIESSLQPVSAPSAPKAAAAPTAQPATPPQPKAAEAAMFTQPLPTAVGAS